MPGKPPFYPQEHDYSCVPACLRMLLAYNGIYKSEDDLIYACNSWPDGTKVSDLVEAAKGFGFEETSRERLTLDELRDAIREESFPIVYIATPIVHSVLVVAIEDFVEVLDPAHPSGEYKIALKNFLEQWGAQRNLA